MKTSGPVLSELMLLVKANRDTGGKYQVLSGFDGFVDKIQRPVKKKLGDGNLYFETIDEFAEHLKSLKGRSGQVEVTTEKTKLGGNAPILCNAFGKLGIRSICIGAMGLPDTDPVFKAMSHHSKVISVVNPGESNAIEFADGKIILSDLSVFDQYDWRYLKGRLNINEIQHQILNCQLLAFVDWVNLPCATDLWEGFLHDVIRPLHKKDFHFLFDLCDPSRKSIQQIDEVLDLMSSFSTYGTVTLGLNENETNRIWMALKGIDPKSNILRVNLPPLKEAGRFIFNMMAIDNLLIHPVDRTIVISKADIIEMKGRVVEEPKVQTGGGDNLNAGYCLGQLLGLDIRHCMLLGMAASGSYVQNGY
ncbi:MAG TPA: hypothetical protein VFW11_05045, partial [Cyclobacteriaceae bacterium]|nr:hypothetical protein [Cyclobacteriaceae bacterium]